MSRDTEKKLLDIGIWFEENRRSLESSKDPKQTAEFCLRMCEHMLWALSYVVEDVRRVEGRQRAPELILPLRYRYPEAISRMREGDDAA